MASLLHYHFIKTNRANEEAFSSEGNVEFLQGRRGEVGFSKIQDVALSELKNYLIEQGIACRQMKGIPA